MLEGLQYPRVPGNKQSAKEHRWEWHWRLFPEGVSALDFAEKGVERTETEKEAETLRVERIEQGVAREGLKEAARNQASKDGTGAKSDGWHKY